MGFASSTIEPRRSFLTFFLIYFCTQLFLPNIVIADGSGSTILGVASSGAIIMSSEDVLSTISQSSSSIATDVSSILPNVVISEVMWMGSDKSTADEWIEITGISTGNGSIGIRSLSGWTLTVQKTTGESVVAKFPSTTQISSGSFLVVSNYTKDLSRLSSDPSFISTAMSLPNTALLIRLRDELGNVIDTADDGVGSPFAGSNPSSNGPKAGMERIYLLVAGTVQSNWRSATVSRGFDDGVSIFGTPGSANGLLPITASSSSFSSLASVALVESGASSLSIDQNSSSNINLQPSMKLKINELLPNPSGSDDAEWIEIVNTGSGTANLSGMILRTGTSPHRIKTGAALMVEPGSFVVVQKSSIGFSLINNGSTVTLESGSTVLDTFSYEGMAVEGVSIGRMSDGNITSFCVPTPGIENASIPLDPSIIIESGRTTGYAPVTLNLGVKVFTGSLFGSSCHFDFGDGYTTGSCNPASHTIRSTGDYMITVKVSDYCSNTVVRTLTGSVYGITSPQIFDSFYSSSGATEACVRSRFSGATITELVPNPTGEESDGEWIEIYNNSSTVLPLCGWSLDDEQAGSRPYSLSRYQLAPHSYLVLPRKQSGITLNNDHDQVRLIAPLPAGGTGVSMAVQFDNASDDQSYAIDESGNWKWTRYLTPGSANALEDPSNLFEPSPIQISAALPNPHGVDTYDEWIELTNTAGWPIWLNGWKLRDSDGKELDLTGTVLSKLQTKRIYLYRTKYVLTNEHDTLYLVDEKNSVRSILSWKKAGEGIIQRAYQSTKPAGKALVRQIIDGDTIVVQKEGDPADQLVRVRLQGIDAPELYQDNEHISVIGIIAKDYIRSLLLNKKIELQFDTIKQDAYGRTIAYVFLDGVDVQQKLLTSGLAYAYREYEVGRLSEYEAYEALARKAKVGIWDTNELSSYYDKRIAEQEQWRLMHEHGLRMKIDTPEGLVGSGSLLHITTHPLAQIYLSTNFGPYSPFTGGLLLNHTQTIRAYAVAKLDDSTESLRSDLLQKTFVVEEAVYNSDSMRISEVYPSPDKGESEWIELENTGDLPVSLAGWKLDDVGSGGSVPVMLQSDAVIPAHGYLLFLKSITGLSLNNGGDEVNLLNPFGEIIDHMKYSSTKTGRAVAWEYGKNMFCITDKPTPLESNTCFIQSKKSTRKLPIKSGVNSKSKKIIKKTKAEIAAEKYLQTQSGVYVDLSGQITSKKQSEMTSNIFYGFGNGLFLGFLLSVSAFFGWIFRNKYSFFLSYFKG
jgi:micrococcal nuclease